jgi:hypothetical protein
MIRMLRLALPLVAVSSLPGCALGPSSSYVSQVDTPADAQALAAGMVVFVAAQLPAASSTVVLDPTPSDQAGNALTPAFVAALRDRGFAVADEGQAGHHIRYLVTSLDSGDLVRVSIDDSAEASRFFVRNAEGGLQAGGPFLVRQTAEAG